MHGTQLNASQVGQGLGVSYHTVQSQIDFLEGAFLVCRLRPYFANNFPKRLTKAPKIYWRDSGLLHFLLGLSGTEEVSSQRWVGNSWEGWVIEQIITARQGTGEVFNAWYFRTNDGLECDLVIESGKEREVIEIKLASTPSREDFNKLAKIADLLGATRQVIISRTDDRNVIDVGDRWSVNLSAYLGKFLPRPAPLAISGSPPIITVPLLYLSKVSEIGQTVIPHLWLSNRRLRDDICRPTQHLDTLNEVWWLSRWQGIDAGSVQREYLARRDEHNLRKKDRATMDWRFTVLGDQVAINLSVKNRPSTMGSEVLDKRVYLFDRKEPDAFGESATDEINVLAITAYHGGWITRNQQDAMIDEYFNNLDRQVIDAVALSVRCGSQGFSEDRLYFPQGRNLDKKDLILKAVFKPMDAEDHSKLGVITYPKSLSEAIEAMRQKP